MIGITDCHMSPPGSTCMSRTKGIEPPYSFASKETLSRTPKLQFNPDFIMYVLSNRRMFAQFHDSNHRLPHVPSWFHRYVPHERNRAPYSFASKETLSRTPKLQFNPDENRHRLAVQLRRFEHPFVHGFDGCLGERGTRAFVNCRRTHYPLVVDNHVQEYQASLSRQ